MFKYKEIINQNYVNDISILSRQYFIIINYHLLCWVFVVIMNLRWKIQINLINLYYSASLSFIIYDRFVYDTQNDFQYYNISSSIILNRHKFGDK